MKFDTFFKIFIFIFVMLVALLVDIYFDKHILSEIVSCHLNLSKKEVQQLTEDLSKVEQIDNELILELKKKHYKRRINAI